MIATRSIVLFLGVDKLLEHYKEEKKTNETETVAQAVHDVTLKNNEIITESDKEAANNLKEKGSHVELQANVNITDEEKERLVATSPTTTNMITVIDHPFLETIYEALDCTENDYAALFALCLLYAMSNNSG